MPDRSSFLGLGNLIGLLLALAVLLAPAVTHMGMASAADPHLAQSMEQVGHCHSTLSRTAEHGKSPVKSCCIATCIAVAVQPTAAPDLKPVLRLAVFFSAPTFRIGRLSEIATPPPKLR